MSRGGCTGCWLHTITDYERLVQDEVKAAVDSTSDDGRSPWIENQRKTEDLFEEDPLTELKNIAGVKAKTLNDAGLLTVADLKMETRDEVKALAKASKCLTCEHRSSTSFLALVVVVEALFLLRNASAALNLGSALSQVPE